MKTTLESFKVIGIAVKTSNQDNRALKDITQLWSTFLEENKQAEIPQKIDDDILCIYTEYEGDHTQPYTVLLGCRVAQLDDIPEGMLGMLFQSGVYASFAAQGSLSEGVVAKKWYEIWNTALDRSYIADFEVYGDKSQDPQNATVDIYIGLTK